MEDYKSACLARTKINTRKCNTLISWSNYERKIHVLLSLTISKSTRTVLNLPKNNQNIFGTLKICNRKLRNKQATKASLLKREYQQSWETSDKTICQTYIISVVIFSLYIHNVLAETYTYRLSLFKICYIFLCYNFLIITARYNWIVDASALFPHDYRVFNTSVSDLDMSPVVFWYYCHLIWSSRWGGGTPSSVGRTPSCTGPASRGYSSPRGHHTLRQATKLIHSDV